MGATEFDKPLDHDLDELNSKFTIKNFSGTSDTNGLITVPSNAITSGKTPIFLGTNNGYCSGWVNAGGTYYLRVDQSNGQPMSGVTMTVYFIEI